MALKTETFADALGMSGFNFDGKKLLLPLGIAVAATLLVIIASSLGGEAGTPSVGEEADEAPPSSGEGPVICDICGETFESAGILAGHRMMAHSHELK